MLLNTTYAISMGNIENNFVVPTETEENFLVPPKIEHPFVSTMSNLSSPLGLLMAFILIIVSIVMLVKSIKQNKLIKADISTDTINKVKRVSVSLIVLYVLTLAFNAFSLIFLIVSIISNRISTQAKKYLTEENNIDQARSKISTACLINTIITCLTILLALGGWGISIAIWKIINLLLYM